MAFRRERPAWMYRFAGGLGGMATGLHQHWRSLILATLMAGLLGAATGQALPPTYQARATLELLGSRDYGSALGVQEALQRVRAGGVRLEPAPPGQGVNLALAIESTSPDRDAASAMAQAEAQKAIQSLGEALRDTRYNSRDMQLRLGSEVQVEEKRPVPLAAAVGGTLAFAVGVLVLFRQRHLGRS